MSTSTKISRRSLLVMAMALAACKNRGQVMEIMGFSMGTTYNVVAVDHDNQLNKSQVKAAIDSALAEVNKHLSNWDESSEISRFNAARGSGSFTMSSELAEVMHASTLVHQASHGRFDTTIGPLIELWGFGAAGGLSVPTKDAIAHALETSGQSNTLTVANGQIGKRQPGAQVYLAGIGKGYGADYVGRKLESLGLKDYMVEIGGDLYTAGRNPDGLPWQIGIEAPNATDRSVLGVVGLSGLGLATSGDYRNYFEADGQRFSHLIDPTTGRPVTHATASATVLADNAMLADAWSTAMLILGRDQGLEIAREHNVAVQFIERNRNVAKLSFKTYTSPQFDALAA